MARKPIATLTKLGTGSLNMRHTTSHYSNIKFRKVGGKKKTKQKRCRAPEYFAPSFKFWNKMTIKIRLSTDMEPNKLWNQAHEGHIWLCSL